jgi:hypothetical protein
MIIQRCTFDGCAQLTIGPRCVEHDVPVTRTFVRGRPFQRTAAVHVMHTASATATRMALVPFAAAPSVLARA